MRHALAIFVVAAQLSACEVPDPGADLDAWDDPAEATDDSAADDHRIDDTELDGDRGDADEGDDVGASDPGDLPGPDDLVADADPQLAVAVEFLHSVSGGCIRARPGGVRMVNCDFALATPEVLDQIWEEIWDNRFVTIFRPDRCLEAPNGVGRPRMVDCKTSQNDSQQWDLIGRRNCKAHPNGGEICQFKFRNRASKRCLNANAPNGVLRMSSCANNSAPNWWWWLDQ